MTWLPVLLAVIASYGIWLWWGQGGVYTCPGCGTKTGQHGKGCHFK